MKKKPLTDAQIEDAKRLKALYEAKKKDLGLSQESIAHELGVVQSAVAQIFSGKNALNLSRALEFAKILKVSVADFSPDLAKEMAGFSAKGNIAEDLNNLENASYAGPHVPGKKYPLLSAVSAGAWAEANEAYSLKDVDEWYESNAKVQGEAFWLRVEGDSMTAPTGLSIPENTLVLFDTGREAINGSLVIAKLTDVNEATFKKLIIDGGQRYLRGLNPAWPLLPINGNCRIIGVAIQTMMILV